ncbi:MAG: AAA family ATPase [Planctomycetota bacterium]
MAKVSLAEHMQERPAENGGEHPENPGPYITISRQFGCWGFSLGLLLLDLLNEDAKPGQAWKIYHKEILDKLASETNLATDVLEQQRRAKPRLLADFFRSLSGEKIPSGMEVRNRLQTIIRGLAMGGYAIVVGQGGAGATADLENGLRIRLEAPEDWRVKQVAFREGLSETQAKLRIQAKQREQEYLRKLYERRFPRRPAFSLVYDCSVFSLAQIAQHVVHAMQLKGVIER